MEIWKTIEGFEDYQISNLGNVKSFKKHKKGFVLKPFLSTSGYLTITLFIDKKNYKKMIHRLISIAFIENTFNLPCVNHKDGNKTNNNILNLEWCSYKENNNHALYSKLRLPKQGINHVNSKLTEKEVLEIRNSVLSQKKIALKYNISSTLVFYIQKRIRWNHL